MFARLSGYNLGLLDIWFLVTFVFGNGEMYGATGATQIWDKGGFWGTLDPQVDV